MGKRVKAKPTRVVVESDRIIFDDGTDDSAWFKLTRDGVGVVVADSYCELRIDKAAQARLAEWLDTLSATPLPARAKRRGRK